MAKIGGESRLASKRKKRERHYRKFTRRLRVKDSLRLLTHRPGGQPGLVIVGAQKSGTSTLNHLLRLHPDLLGLERKEVHYFNDNFFRGKRWYRSFFPPQDGRLFFEATPDYLCHPFAAERMAVELPNAKLVAMLREPSSRALSQYWMEYMRGEENLEIEAAFDAEPSRLARFPISRLERPRAFSRAHARHGYYWRGLYAEQLENFFDRFDRNRVLIIRAEDFDHDPQAILDQLCDFACVPRFKPEYRRINESLVGDVITQSPTTLRASLIERYAEPNQRLRALTGIHWNDL